MDNNESGTHPLELYISADRPIMRKSDDRLNRSGFAGVIAKVIAQWHNKPSLVIGLFGDWGSGKSSIKNLVVESLKDKGGEKIPVLDFSPWQFSGQDILFDAFFLEIGRALGKTKVADEGTRKRRIARWKRYSSMLSVAATVASAGEAATDPAKPSTLSLLCRTGSIMLSWFASVFKSGAEGVEAEAVLETLSLSELKARISDDLDGLSEPILVILDDIDRLTKEEIRLVFQLVKANADFPNIIYLLLAQKDTVVKALEDVAPDNGDAFLEKIVQVSFNVPAIDRKQLEHFLLDGLNRLLTEDSLSARFDKGHWGSVFPAIFPLFRNFRDLNRFLGSLAFHIEVFRNKNTFEVNPVDLIGLEVIRVFEPNVYRMLPQEKDVLTLEPRWMRDKNREKDKQRIDNLVGLAASERRPTVSRMIATLFPPAGLTYEFDSQSPSRQENLWFNELRVCSYQAFDRYFQLATPEGDVSQSDIDQLKDSMSDQKAMGDLFARFAKRDLLETMLLRLHSLSETLPIEYAPTFLAALYEVEIEERQYGFLEIPPGARITGITYWYLHRIDERRRIDTLKEALGKTVGIGIAVDTVGMFTQKNESETAPEPFIASEEGREELKQACLTAIKRVTGENSLLSPKANLGFLRYWSFWNSDEASTWLSNYLQTRANVVHFLKSIVDTSSGTGGDRRYIILSTKLENLITLKELKVRISTYLDGDYSEEERELLVLVNASIKRIEDGKVENPYLIINGEQ
jgi:predicted KAP-like P-loop ATPase